MVRRREADGDSLRFVDHNNPSACDPSDYANISNEGYEREPIAMGPRNACKFGDIQLVQHQPVKVYLIQVSCPIGWPNWTMWRGKLELETNHTTVTIKFLPEG